MFTIKKTEQEHDNDAKKQLINHINELNSSNKKLDKDLKINTSYNLRERNISTQNSINNNDSLQSEIKRLKKNIKNLNLINSHNNDTMIKLEKENVLLKKEIKELKNNIEEFNEENLSNLKELDEYDTKLNNLKKIIKDKELYCNKIKNEYNMYYVRIITIIICLSYILYTLFN